MGFGAILVNIPLSGAITQGAEIGVLDILFKGGIANELFPLLLFIGIGAMIDFEPLLTNPKLMLFGAAAQFGIFFTLVIASLLKLPAQRRGEHRHHRRGGRPDFHFRRQLFNGSKYIGPIIIAAYSYMSLVPIVQPPIIKLLTTKKRAPYPHGVRGQQSLADDQRFFSRSSSPSLQASLRRVPSRWLAF